MKKTIAFLSMVVIHYVSVAQWSNLISGTTNTLTACYFLDASTGFVGGTGGLIRKTTNGGSSWSTLNTGTSSDITDIRFSSPDVGYAVGTNGTIIKTVDAGMNWSTLNPGVSSTLSRIHITTNALYVSGYSGVMLKSTDAGATWSQLTTGTSNSLYGVYFVNPDTGYVTGGLGMVLKTTNAGSTWTPLTTGTSFNMLSVWFTSDTRGFAVGGDSPSNTGVIIATGDGGATWSTQNFSNNYFGSVRFLNSTVGYTVGGSVTANTSTIYRTNDGGTSWFVESSSSSRQFGSWFPDLNTGYTSGLNGTILKNGGIGASVSDGLRNPQSFQVFPNPFSDAFTLQFNTKNSEYTRISLFDFTGKLIKELWTGNLSSDNQQLVFSTQDLQSGAYLLRVETPTLVSYEKLLKILR